MAITKVRGTVSRVFYQGRGAEVTESFSVKGEERSVRWSCWFEAAHGLAEGDVVQVSGLHSDTVDAWDDKSGETKHSVKRALNKARLATGEIAEAGALPVAGSASAAAPAASQTGAEPPADPWPSTDPYTGGGVPW